MSTTHTSTRTHTQTPDQAESHRPTTPPATGGRARSRLLGLATAAALVLAGCGEGTTTTAPAGDPTPATTAADSAGAQTEDAAGSLTLEEGWAKATDGEMTGVFGTLVNHGDEDVHLVSVQSPVAGAGELHVTVDDGAGGRMMQQAEDGFIIGAGAEHELVPGGDHIMLMELSEEIATGQDVELTLVDEDGAEVSVTVTARAFAGAEEEYAPGDGAGHTMDDADHDDATTAP